MRGTMRLSKICGIRVFGMLPRYKREMCRRLLSPGSRRGDRHLRSCESFMAKIDTFSRFTHCYVNRESEQKLRL